MRTKPKLLVCALIFFGGGFLNLFFSAALHGLLTRTITRLTLIPIGECVAGLLSSRQHLMLFLCMQGFVSILAVLFFLTNFHPYRSDLDEITPEIQTPRAVGQYQHGSARWLSDEEKEKSFESFILDPGDPTIRELIKTGYDGLDFLKEKKEESHANEASPQADPEEARTGERRP